MRDEDRPYGLRAAGVKQMDLGYRMGMSRGGASIATQMFSLTICSYQLYYRYIPPIYII